MAPPIGQIIAAFTRDLRVWIIIISRTETKARTPIPFSQEMSNLAQLAL